MKDLTNHLELLLKDISSRDYVDKAERRFQVAVDTICRQAIDQVPPVSLDEMHSLYNHKGGWEGAVQEKMHELRADLTDHLAQIDLSLKDIIDEIFQEIVVGVIPNALKGILGVNGHVEKDIRAPLNRFRTMLNDETHLKMCKCLDYVVGFDFSYYSHFHYRVRELMGPLDPMKRGTVRKTIPRWSGRFAVRISDRLNDKYREVISKVRERLCHEMNGDPCRAIFALVDEFKDRMVRREGIEKEWKSFLREYRSAAWPDIFGRFADESVGCAEWRKEIENVLRSAEHIRSFLVD